MPIKVKPTVTRDWVKWAAAAIAVALIGIAAGYGSLTLGDPSPAAENYADQRALREYVRWALALIWLGAPLVSLALGLIGRTLIGILAGVVGVASLVALPGLSPACCEGPESSIIGRLRAINSAQQAYSSSCANDKGFANTLETLAKPPVPGSTPFLDPVTARGVWRGYRMTMHIPDGAAVDFVACDGRRVVAAYFIEAHLIEPIPDRRNFATDERGTIYWNRDGTVIQPGMAGAEPLQ